MAKKSQFAEWMENQRCQANQTVICLYLEYQTMVGVLNPNSYKPWFGYDVSIWDNCFMQVRRAPLAFGS